MLAPAVASRIEAWWSAYSARCCSSSSVRIPRRRRVFSSACGCSAVGGENVTSPNLGFSGKRSASRKSASRTGLRQFLAAREPKATLGVVADGIRRGSRGSAGCEGRLGSRLGARARRERVPGDRRLPDGPTRLRQAGAGPRGGVRWEWTQRWIVGLDARPKAWCSRRASSRHPSRRRASFASSGGRRGAAPSCSRIRTNSSRWRADSGVSLLSSARVVIASCGIAPAASLAS